MGGGAMRRRTRQSVGGAAEGGVRSGGTGAGETPLPGRRHCTFQLLKYVPDAVRNEFVHIGVILQEAGTPAEVRFTRDWRRVRCLDAEADTGLLEGMETELRRRLREEPDGRLMHLMEEALSLNVQMTAPKAYLAESAAAGLDELMRMYVEPPKRERTARLGGRVAIQAALRETFEQAGVWELLRKGIAASAYTRAGDPLRIDVGYRTSGMGQTAAGERAGGSALIRMFHAVSLDAGVEMAKVLAFSAAGLRAGVARVEKAELELTAVVEPAARLGASEAEPERLAMYRFGVETMEEHRIRVLTTGDLGRVAETARRELRV